MTDGWMHARLTDYWDEQVRAVDAAARRLQALSGPRRSALEAITAAVTEHVRALPDEMLARAAVPFADDLYQAACSTDRWDDALADYLGASAGTMSRLLDARGFRIQYLVDNAWEDLTKPIQLFPSWYEAAGFVYTCPQAVALDLAQADGFSQDADLGEVLLTYSREARDVVGMVVDQCEAERRHVVQLDADRVDDSFTSAFEARAKRGAITILRNEAPEPGTTVATWLPEGIT